MSWLYSFACYCTPLPYRIVWYDTGCAPVCSRAYSEYCVTRCDTVEEVRCMVAVSEQRTRHTGASACGGPGTACHSGFRRGLPGLHTTHYLTCILHQQALNIKLWMHAKKIPRALNVDKGHFAVQIICPPSVKPRYRGVARFCITG